MPLYSIAASYMYVDGDLGIEEYLCVLLRLNPCIATKFFIRLPTLVTTDRNVQAKCVDAFLVIAVLVDKHREFSIVLIGLSVAARCPFMVNPDIAIISSPLLRIPAKC